MEMLKAWGLIVVVLAIAVSCDDPGERRPEISDVEGRIDRGVPVNAFQRVAGAVLQTAQRGHEEDVQLGVVSEAEHARCTPGTNPCQWVTNRVVLPEEIAKGLEEYHEGIRVLPPPPICQNEIAIAFKDARVLSDTMYMLAVDLVDTRQPYPYVEFLRQYEVDCNSRFCSVAAVYPGDEPEFSISYAADGICEDTNRW